MKKRIICYILIIIMVIISGCNISDYQYTEEKEEVKEICDEKTKICYPITEVNKDSDEKTVEQDDFDKEFEKLKQIVSDMNDETDKLEETTQEENTETAKKTDNTKVVETKTEESTKVTETNTKVAETELEKVVEETDSTKETVDESDNETYSGDIDKYMTVFAGKEIKLNVKTRDPDGDELTYTYSSPLDENGMWQTSMDDIGKYNVIITVSDGKYKQSLRILLEVKKFNRAPVLETIEDIEVYEGDTVFINAKASDEDDDPLDITYSGWMNTKTKKIGYDDAGEYKVTVTVTDDDGDSDSQIVNILINDQNRPFIIQGISADQR